MPQRATCRIDFSVDDQARSIRELVERVARVADLPSSVEVEFDLLKCRYLGPDAVALLGSVLLQRRRVKSRCAVLAPESPPELRAFLRVSGLEALWEKGELRPREAGDDDKPVLPLAQYDAARFQDADPIIQMLQRHGTMRPEFDEYLRICVNEVLQNVQDHAKSPIGGLMIARFMKKAAEVRVAIVDRGNGICSTLRRRFPDTNAENVLPRVLGGNYTAASRENNLGLGLSNLAVIIKQLGGDLVIVSENSMAEVRRNHSREFHTLAARFQGTGVFFTLPVQS